MPDVGAPVAFRLPVPPSWGDEPPRVSAAERRARKAYFAALDALTTGVVHPLQAVKARRFAAEVRGSAAQRTLEHLLRLFAVARREGRPVLAPPSMPARAVTITVPAAAVHLPADALARRYALTLEWLRTRRWIAGKDVVVTWRAAHAAASVTARAA